MLQGKGHITLLSAKCFEMLWARVNLRMFLFPVWYILCFHFFNANPNCCMQSEYCWLGGFFLLFFSLPFMHANGNHSDGVDFISFLNNRKNKHLSRRRNANMGLFVSPHNMHPLSPSLLLRDCVSYAVSKPSCLRRSFLPLNGKRLQMWPAGVQLR